MIKAMHRIRHNGKEYAPGDTLPKLTADQQSQLTAAGAIVIEPDPAPESEPKAEPKPARSRKVKDAPDSDG